MELGLELGLRLGFISFRHSLDDVQILFGGWVAGGVGWLEKWGSKLTSAKVEVEADFGTKKYVQNPEHEKKT